MDQKRVVNELTQGKEFAKQLQIHLTNPSSSHETQEILMHNILNSYEKSLSLLTIRGLTGESHLHRGIEMITRLESEISFSESPRSAVSDHPDYKDLGAKRKRNGGVEKWKNQVKVRGDMGFEEAFDDGYSWRKYGQKDILGAKHPRGYYRCSYRQLEGCLATKYIQQTNEDPNIFNITYRGSHSCKPSTLPLPPCSSPLHQPQRNQFLRSPETTLTENLETHSFRFPSTSKNNFVFPTPDSAFYGYKTRQVHMVEEAEGGMVVGSELKEIVPAATSITSSHDVDMAFPFGEVGFGENFNFDNSIFFY